MLNKFDSENNFITTMQSISSIVLGGSLHHLVINECYLWREREKGI